MGLPSSSTKSGRSFLTIIFIMLIMIKYCQQKKTLRSLYLKRWSRKDTSLIKTSTLTILFNRWKRAISTVNTKRGTNQVNSEKPKKELTKWYLPAGAFSGTKQLKFHQDKFYRTCPNLTLIAIDTALLACLPKENRH